MTPVSRIESLGVALPARRMTMDEVVAGCRAQIELPLTAWTGIVAHQRGGKDEFAYDLARRAVASCLARSRVAPSEIGLIISCNISRVDAPGRYAYEPANASRLAAHFGMHGALAFDINNACAGMLTGLALASDFLATGRTRTALVLSGEYITHLSDTAQREIRTADDTALSCLTLGDAGVAVLLEANPSGDGVGFERIELQTLSTFSHLCVSSPTYTEEGGNIMRTDSVRLGFVGTREGVRHMRAVLAAMGQTPRDFDHVLLHQTSLATIQGSIKAGKRAWGEDALDESKVIINLTERGNTATTTHWLAIWDKIHSGQIRDGDRILLAAVASGLVVSTGILRIGDLPTRLLAEAAAPPAPGPALPDDWVTPASASPRVRFEAIGLADPAVGTDPVALCQSAGEAALAQSSHRRDELSHLVYFGVHRTGWHAEPATAAFVASALKTNDAEVDLDHATLAFDLSQGGTGFLTACELARQLIAARESRRVLLTSAEMDPNPGPDSPFAAWLRCSGVAVLVDPSPDADRGLGSVLIRRFPEQVETLTSDLFFNLASPYQTLAGREQAVAFLLDPLAPAVAQLLAAEGIDLGDLRLVLTPACSPDHRAQVAQRLGLPLDRVYDPAEERGDRHTCSLPYLLAHARQQGAASPGDRALLVEFGSGLTLAVGIYTF